MRHSSIKRTPPFWRIWGGFLCLSLALPNPAHALRPQLNRSGLEEKLTAGMEEEGDELELVSFLAELRQIMEEGNWPDISQLGPLSPANRFLREDPPLNQPAVEALNETVQEISRNLQGNPPEDPRIQALLRKLQAVMVRYLMATWNLSEQAASDFSVDNSAYQGNVWSMQILQWGDSFQEERPTAESEGLDFDSSNAMQHIGAYLMLGLTTPPQQFDDPRAADQSLNVYRPGFYLLLRNRARQMQLQQPRFGPEQMTAGIKRYLAQWAGEGIPLQLKIDILRERHPALRNAALVFGTAFARTITELGYSSMGMELSRQIQKGFESLRKDYPDYPIWRPGDPPAGLEEEMGFVLVEGVGLVAPSDLPEQSYFAVAVGLEQAAVLIQAGRAPRRIIAVATGLGEVSGLAALGIPGNQIVQALDWPTLEAAKDYAVRLGREWLAGLGGLQVSVLEVTARSLQGILAQLREMLPSAWQTARPITTEEAQSVLDNSV